MVATLGELTCGSSSPSAATPSSSAASVPTAEIQQHHVDAAVDGPGPAGPRPRPGHHPRQRAPGRPARPRERRRPGADPPLPARRPRRPDPGHDRLLAPPGARERRCPGARWSSLVCQTVVDGGRSGLRPPHQVRRTRLLRRRSPRGWPRSGRGRSEPTGSGGAGSSPPPSRRRSSSWRPSGRCSPTAPWSSAPGGGGIPVVRSQTACCDGVEAVIDKDLAAALLARGSTPTPSCSSPTSPRSKSAYGTPDATAHRTATAAELRALPSRPGSMGPKVEAACRFVEATGGIGAIGHLTDAAAVLEGRAGTRVVADSRHRPDSPRRPGAGTRTGVRSGSTVVGLDH